MARAYSTVVVLVKLDSRLQYDENLMICEGPYSNCLQCQHEVIEYPPSGTEGTDLLPALPVHA